jgi:hypothetical protein
LISRISDPSSYPSCAIPGDATVVRFMLRASFYRRDALNRLMT